LKIFTYKGTVLPEDFKSLAAFVNDVLNETSFCNLHTRSESLYTAKCALRRHKKAIIFLLSIHFPRALATEDSWK